MLGMNDGEFPRNQSPLGFDLIAAQPRKGDRLLREDDRYLFLESLLAAREVVHISYVGRSQQDNSARLASVVVTELLDYIHQGYQIENEGNAGSLLIEHPLQPFSPRSFELGSYASEWLERTDGLEPFAAQAIEQVDDDSAVVSVDELLRFIVNPARHFLQYTLGIHSAEYEESLDDSECFQLDALAAYQIKDINLQALLAGEDLDQNFALVQARGELPHGAFAQQSFASTNEGLEDLSEEIKQHLLNKEPAAEISLQIADTSLSGWLPVLVNGGVFRYRPAKFKAKDQLTLWVEHLVNCASGGTGASTHLATDYVFSLLPIGRDVAIQYLEKLIHLYRQGQRQALPFFPASSIAFAKEIYEGGSVEDAHSAAATQWEGGRFNRSDCQDPWFEQAFRGAEPLNEHFQTLASEVLLPMLAVAQQEKRR
jgi:exodeoxyribonuclease V gamma subunit